MELAERILMTMKEIRAGSYEWSMQGVHSMLSMFNKAVVVDRNYGRLLNMFVDFTAQAAVNASKFDIDSENRYIEKELESILTIIWGLATTAEYYPKLQIMLFSVQRISKGLIRFIDTSLSNRKQDYKMELIRVCAKIVFVHNDSQRKASVSNFLELLEDLRLLKDLNLFSELQNFVQASIFNSLKAIRHALLYCSVELLSEVKTSPDLLSNFAELNELMFNLQQCFLQSRTSTSANNAFRVVALQSILEYFSLGLLISALEYSRTLRKTPDPISLGVDPNLDIYGFQMNSEPKFHLLISCYEEVAKTNSNTEKDILSQINASNSVFRKISIHKNLFLLNLMVFAEKCATNSPRLKDRVLSIVRLQLANSPRYVDDDDNQIDSYLIMKYLFDHYYVANKAYAMKTLFNKVLLPKFVSEIDDSLDVTVSSFLRSVLETMKVEDLLHTCFVLLKTNKKGEYLDLLVDRISNYLNESIIGHDAKTTLSLKLLHAEVLYLMSEKALMPESQQSVDLNTLELLLDKNKSSLSPILYLILKHNLALKNYSVVIKTESSVLTVHSTARKMLVDLAADLSSLIKPIMNINLDFNTFIKIFFDDYKNIINQLIAFECEGKNMLIELISLLDIYTNLAQIYNLEKYDLVILKTAFLVAEASFSSVKSFIELSFLDLYFAHVKVDSYAVNHKMAIQFYQSRYKKVNSSSNSDKKAMNAIELDCRVRELQFYSYVSPIKVEEYSDQFTYILNYLDKRCSNDNAVRTDLVIFVRLINLYLENANNQVYKMKLISEAIFLLKSIKDKLGKTPAESNFYIFSTKNTLNCEFNDRSVDRVEAITADLSYVLYNKNSNIRAFSFLLDQLTFLINQLIECGHYNSADKLCEVNESVAQTVISLPYIMKTYCGYFKIRNCIDFPIHKSLIDCFDIPDEVFAKPSIQEIMKSYRSTLSSSVLPNNNDGIEEILKFGFCVAVNKLKLNNNMPLNFTMPLFFRFSIRPIMNPNNRPISYFKYLIVSKLNEASQMCPLFLYYFNPKALKTHQPKLQVFSFGENNMSSGVESLLSNLAYSLNAHSRKYRRFLYSYILFRIANSFHEFCFKNQQTAKNIQMVHHTNYSVLFFGLFKYGINFDFIDLASDAFSYFMSTWVATSNIGQEADNQVTEHTCQFCTARERVDEQLTPICLIAYFINIGFRFKYCYKKTFVNENERSNVRKTLKRISIKYASSIPEISQNSILLKLKSRKAFYSCFLENNRKWMSMHPINKQSEALALGCFEWIFDISKKLTYAVFYNFKENSKSFLEINQNPSLAVGSSAYIRSSQPNHRRE